MSLAPIRVCIFPLIKKEEAQVKMSLDIYNNLMGKGIYCVYDVSGAIGRRYRRNDELGTPFAITIDYQSIIDETVTIRNRDTTKQKRIKIEEIYDYVKTKYD